MLAIKKLSNEHSHDLVDNNDVKLDVQKRKLTDEEEGIVSDMIIGGGDAKLIAEVIHEKTGKVILPKQVYNVKHKFQSIDVGNHTEDLAALKKVSKLRIERCGHLKSL